MFKMFKRAGARPSLAMTTKTKGPQKKAKGKPEKAKDKLYQADLRSSVEKLCQELHLSQLRLRTTLHPALPNHRTAPSTRCATLLGLPHSDGHGDCLETLVELCEVALRKL